MKTFHTVEATIMKINRIEVKNCTSGMLHLVERDNANLET